MVMFTIYELYVLCECDANVMCIR